ncbi:MAG: hypothetical protein JWP57_4130, partial [Spirosoma sp.]|nr:hypothetical protein [Spirosoma sp.]
EKLERMYWLVEGCFISRSFPHSAMMPAGDEWSNVNYARQSVLGVCDATTGQTNFYLFDPSEPLARAWNALLPNFFRPARELPDALRTGTRLSAALLSAQSVMWARYHPAASDQDEVATWKKGTDQWQQFDVFDSSERDAVAQPVVVERKGQPEMELMAAFSHWGGTVTDSTVPASGTNPASQLTLVALLGARDEGDAIWKGHGQTPLSAWRAAQPFAVPLSESPPEEPPLSPFLPEFFDKLALVPLLDAKGDCVGMQISRGRAERKRIKGGATPWTLANGVASTKIQFVAPSSAPSPVQERENMLRLRTLWKSWKEARANGRWERVEKLEGQINQLLAP